MGKAMREPSSGCQSREEQCEPDDWLHFIGWVRLDPSGQPHPELFSSRDTAVWGGCYKAQRVYVLVGEHEQG